MRVTRTQWVRKDRREVYNTGILGIRSVHHVKTHPQRDSPVKGNMTRDFNKQRRERDDMRPYARKQPPRRPGEERFARPDRPRLNRETVDRAWENGAQVNHADYHTRTGNSRPGSPYGQRQRFSDQNGRNNSTSGYRRDYESNHFEREQEDRGRGNDRYHYSPGNGGQRSRSYNNGRFDEPRSNGYQRRERDGRPDFREQGYDRSYPTREQGYTGRSSRYGERDTRSSHYNGRGQRPSSGGAPYETRTPRRNYSRPREQEQFEGDYERFHSFEERPARSQAGAQRFERRPAQERHVTRLPDGRVLKGSRPAQRKNAQFWTEIAEDTDALVPHPHGNRQAARTQRAAGRKRERKASSAPASGDNVPRPSQRGFKWPRTEPEPEE